MLEARNICADLGGRRVLDDASVSAHAGEVMAIVGPNGAGKSTLLRVLGGELAPASGRVMLAGDDIVSLAPAALARIRALMPQQAGLSFPFRVEDVVAMGRAPFRTDATPDTDIEAIRWAMAATDIAALAGRPYTRLSGGEQQRVQLARVLAQVWRRASCAQTRFLLLDEPTASLDLAHQHATLHLARGLAREGAGVVAVVHDLNLAAAYADRVAVVSGGAIVAAGVPDDILRPDFIASVFALTVRRIFDAPSGRHLLLPVGHLDARAQGSRLAAAQ